MSGYGMLGHVMVNFQNSFGTSLVTSQEAIAVTEAGLVKGIEQIAEAGMYSRLSESPYHDGVQSFEGEISLEASPISIGYFLKSVIGYTQTTSGTGENVHIFKPRNSDFDEFAACDPMTIEQHLDVGSAGLFSDMCGNTLALNIANSELLDLTAGFIGAGFTRKDPSTPVYPTASPFKWDQMSGSFNGEPILDITDLTLNFNNNLQSFYTLQNCSVPRKIKRTSMQVIELTGTMIFQSHSYWQAYEAGSELPFVLNFSGIESPNNLKIDIPLLRFKSYEPTIAGAGIIEASFTAGAMFSVTSNTALEITLTNTQVGYLEPNLA